MKATEFKPGNKILYNGDEVTISIVKKNSIQFADQGGRWWNPESSSFAPAPITEQHLEELNCRKISEQRNLSSWQFILGPLVFPLHLIFDADKKSVLIDLGTHSSQSRFIKKLHTLQNLLDILAEPSQP